MERKRQSDRKALKLYMKANNVKTGDLLGHAVDITDRGIMLTSEAPIETGAGFDLELELPAEIEGSKSFHFSARSLWSAKDSETDFYNTGFEFSDLSDRGRQVVAQLMNKYCF